MTQGVRSVFTHVTKEGQHILYNSVANMATPRDNCPICGSEDVDITTEQFQYHLERVSPYSRQEGSRARDGSIIVEIRPGH